MNENDSCVIPITIIKNVSELRSVYIMYTQKQSKTCFTAFTTQQPWNPHSSKQLLTHSKIVLSVIFDTNGKCVPTMFCAGDN